MRFLTNIKTTPTLFTFVPIKPTSAPQPGTIDKILNVVDFFFESGSTNFLY